MLIWQNLAEAVKPTLLSDLSCRSLFAIPYSEDLLAHLSKRRRLCNLINVYIQLMMRSLCMEVCLNVWKTNLGVLDMKRLLFLCNRGIVSGPMAKALFQHMGPSLLLNWEVTNVIGLCYDNNKGVGTMTIMFVMLMIQ